MNVKLAWEIGWRLGMAKRAAPGDSVLPIGGATTPGQPTALPGVKKKAPFQVPGGLYNTNIRDLVAPKPTTTSATSGPLSLSSGGSGVDPAIVAKQKAEADTLAKAGPISLYDSDDGDENGPISLNDSDDWDGKSPLSLYSGDESAAQATHRRNMQLYGVDAANRMKAGGGQQGQENDFWSLSPERGKQMTADMYNKFLGFNSPAEYSGWREARTSGLGRALKARGDDQFARMMLGNM